MPPERRANRGHSAETVESRSDGDGALLKPALVFTIGTAVGWVAYVFAALVVLNYLVRLDATVTVLSGLSPTENLWLAVGVLVIVAFAVFARPAAVLKGWLLIAGLIAVTATYLPAVGWTQTVVIVEALTLGFAGFAGFVTLVSVLPDDLIFGIFLLRHFR